jgi:hypothetical protein
VNDDLKSKNPEELRAEIVRLRDAIRKHRDSSKHELCWHHPELWTLLPEPVPGDIAVPDWPQFLRGCIRYRQSLDEQLPSAPRTTVEFSPLQQSARTCAWTSTLGSHDGLETLVWGQEGAAGIVQAFTPEDGVFALHYQLRWGPQFQLSSAEIVCWHRGARHSRQLIRRPEGRWFVDGAEVEALKGCTDFDLWPTPFTNTLAVERLRLRLGERSEIAVAYCSAPTLMVHREVQTYKRLGDRSYRFESPGTQFVADLELDSQNLVRTYPGLFSQISDVTTPA